MTRISLLETAHGIVRQHLMPGGIAVDATLGNGHDTVFLAQCVGDSGRVYGFDIQSQALVNSRQRLREHGLESRAALFHASHADMLAHIPEALQGRIRACMFNLGYLPGADKTVITRSESTLAGLDAACYLSAEEGVITVLAYPGHAGGDSETQRVADWCGRLDRRQFQFEIMHSNFDRPTAPRLFVIRKQADLL